MPPGALAGVGIVYSWGKAKLEFRRHTIDENPNHFRDNVLTALDREKVLDIARLREFARRGHGYRCLYFKLSEHQEEELWKNHGTDGFKLVEKHQDCEDSRRHDRHGGSFHHFEDDLCA